MNVTQLILVAIGSLSLLAWGGSAILPTLKTTGGNLFAKLQAKTSGDSTASVRVADWETLRNRLVADGCEEAVKLLDTVFPHLAHGKETHANP